MYVHVYMKVYHYIYIYRMTIHVGEVFAQFYEMVSFQRLAKKYIWSKPFVEIDLKGEDGGKIWTQKVQLWHLLLGLGTLSTTG